MYCYICYVLLHLLCTVHTVIYLLHLICTISQEQYSQWSWFLVHLCKMMITPGFFSFFCYFQFLAFRGQKAKKWPKMTKKSVCCNWYLRNHISDDCNLWYTCVKWWCLQGFASFFQIFDFGLLEGRRDKRAKNGPKWEKILCVTFHISIIHYMILIYGSHV